ncbi:MAG: TM2 domain-containing protein [Cyclobacteriaceae bacterium]|nr:TM2 domain-containing protein [Cyclobacteriaceae bacterium]
MKNFHPLLSSFILSSIIVLSISFGTSCSSPKYYSFNNKHDHQFSNDYQIDRSIPADFNAEIMTTPQLAASAEIIEKEIEKIQELADSKGIKSQVGQLQAARKIQKEIKVAEKELKQLTVSSMDPASSHFDDRSNQGDKSQLAALLIAIFVGGLGIHRFYLGYIGIGILQLLTGGGCGIWALIDIIRIATGDLKPRNGEYYDRF